MSVSLTTASFVSFNRSEKKEVLAVGIITEEKHVNVSIVYFGVIAL